MATPADNRIRFGIFDFDPAARELRREGTPVRLQPQPAQVLACLLARPGEVVSREEIRQAVWGADTFVDFDRSLNFCIAQIRSALGDSSDSPRYVKTLPKRGYQFIAPVSGPAESNPIPPARRHTSVYLAILAAIVVVAAMLLLAPKVQTDPTRVAVARFDNLTGDPTFDTFTDALTAAVIVELTAAGENRYGVIGNASILRQPKAQRDLMAIHEGVKANAIVLGDVQRNAEGIHLFAQLISLPNQRHLKAIRIHTAKAEPVSAQSELAKRVREEFSPRLTTSFKP